MHLILLKVSDLTPRRIGSSDIRRAQYLNYGTGLDVEPSEVPAGLDEVSVLVPGMTAHYTRAAIHHAAALTAQEIISRKTGKDVQLFSQEPGYCQPVREFVESQGFTVYSGAGRDSHGFIDADDDTLVISILPGVPVRAVLADIARPPIIITTGCLKGSYDERREWHKFQEIPDEELSRFRSRPQLTTQRLKVKMPKKKMKIPAIPVYWLSRRG
ncbi:hypothetical protein F4779DRAFT_516449 [Xylariaceae sp. FL0662B]|nr:hypothetical protein F4779DRAFT_516449 [Xylariaceae sp. FL0662B]